MMQRRRRKHGANRASERIRNDVSAFVAHVCPQRPARGNWQDYRPGWKHGSFHGPHLDFRIVQRGQYKNFEKLALPPSDPVTKKNLPEFTAVREKFLPVLKNPSRLQVSISSAAAQ